MATVTRSGGSSREALRRAGVWAIVLLAGLALLYARYDWAAEDGRFARRGFWLSAYLFLILLPTSYYGIRRLLHSPWAARGVGAAIFLVATLPYELLGLDRFAYYRDRPQWFRPDQVPQPPRLEFFPGGALRAFPYDELFVPLLFAAGCGLIWGAWWVRRRVQRGAGSRLPVLLTVAFAVICTQAYLHSSMRAPMNYVTHFDKAEQTNYWHVVYHFRDGSGAGNADESVYFPLEDYFQGNPRDGDNQLIRRPLSFYVASQFTYFINKFYVWLGLNCLFWLAAVLATGRLVTLLAGRRAGLIAAALTVFGPGFVAFAATPAMYLQSYAAAAIAVWAFEELIVRRAPARDPGSVALFTGVLALCALVYDLAPLMVALIAYGLARRVRPAVLAVCIGGAFVASRLFAALVTTGLGIDIVQTNGSQVSESVSNTVDFLLSPSLPAWYDAAASIPANFLELLLMAFFIVPLLLAAVALPKLRRHRPTQVLVGGLLAAYFLMNAIFVIGKPAFPLGEMPRLIYFLFPAVYLLAGMALDPGDRRATPAEGSLTAASTAVRHHAPWIVVAAMAVLVNVDLFGYPTMYVEFFHGRPPLFLPR